VHSFAPIGHPSRDTDERMRYANSLSTLTFLALLACGGVSNTAAPDCEPAKAAPPASVVTVGPLPPLAPNAGTPGADPATTDAGTNVPDAAAPLPEGKVTFVEATREATRLRTMTVSMPKSRKVGDTIVAVWRMPGGSSPQFVEKDRWTIVALNQITGQAVGRTEQLLIATYTVISDPSQGGIQEVTVHSGDYQPGQEISLLLFRGARKVEPLTSVRTMHRQYGIVEPTLFTTPEGTKSLPFYVFASSAPVVATVPPAHVVAHQSDRLFAFTAQDNALPLTTPSLVAAPKEWTAIFSAAIVAE
jgi:hypothetical protein